MFQVVFAIDIDRGKPWALLTSQPDVQKQALCKVNSQHTHPISSDPVGTCLDRVG
jgi:hypothetical protein